MVMTNARQAGPETEQLARRMERKFFVLPQNIGLAYALLRQVCHLDSKYPEEQINSLYFDTDDLEQYERSSDGDSHKDKIRIRWYHTLDDYQGEVPIFVELKTREGFTSSKKRRRLISPVANLETVRLSNGIIPMRALIDTIASFGYFPAAPIRPVIVISYKRYRFTEALTGMRVALDYNIRSTVINGSLSFGKRELKLGGGVIELKGNKIELPAILRRVKLLDIDWSRFSKYLSCLNEHLSWPDTL